MGDKAGFYVRKWVSNFTEVLADVSDEGRASEVDLEKSQLRVTKKLGGGGPGPRVMISSYFIIRHHQRTSSTPKELS